jgi:hypothetical protein
VLNLRSRCRIRVPRLTTGAILLFERMSLRASKPSKWAEPSRPHRGMLRYCAIGKCIVSRTLPPYTDEVFIETSTMAGDPVQLLRHVRLSIVRLVPYSNGLRGQQLTWVPELRPDVNPRSWLRSRASSKPSEDKDLRSGRAPQATAARLRSTAITTKAVPCWKGSFVKRGLDEPRQGGSTRDSSPAPDGRRTASPFAR